MKAATTRKRSAKHQREHQVLISCVEYFLKTGKPVGSNTLKQEEFQGLSSATIRNYFAELEKEGLLTQQHASGGRVPTSQAYRIYAEQYIDSEILDPQLDKRFAKMQNYPSSEVTSLLEKGAEELSDATKMAVFMGAPRFDHDYLIDVKLVGIDVHRCLCVLITNFGVIRTETLYSDKKLTAFAIKRIEGYFHWRLTGFDKPENMEEDEEKCAQTFYNEAVVRYIVGYAHFIDEEIYRTGFSKLLSHSEFDNARSISQGLALFENRKGMQHLLTETCRANTLKWWIDEELIPFAPGSANCSVISIPYYVGQDPVGAVGILGPMRMKYRELFGVIRSFGNHLSEALTKIVYKYQITYRNPQEGALLLHQEEQKMIGQFRPALLVDKREES